MTRILILGGTGFVGRALCEQLGAHPAFGATRLIVPSRRRERAKHLFPLPNVDVLQAQVHDDATLASLVKGCDAVVNLVAILHGSPTEFNRAHVELPRRLAEACAQAGVPRLVHVSALGVGEDLAAMPSHYLRSKAEGERLLRASGLDVSVLRPSVIFGANDRFLNLFAALQRVFPVMPLAGSDARFQPVWVEDVARALVACLRGEQPAGQDVFEAAGPNVYTLGQLVKLAGKWSGHARPVLPLPLAAGRVQAGLMACLPGEPLMSGDNLDSMKLPNVASGALPGLLALGVTPTALEAIGPTYLGRGTDWASQLDTWRTWAGR